MDTVQEPRDEERFPGLFVDQIPQRAVAIVQGHFFLLCTTQWRSFKKVVAINVETGDVSNLCKEVSGSVGLMDVSQDCFLCVHSSPNEPGSILLGRLTLNSQGEPNASWITLHNLDMPSKYSLRARLDWRVQRLHSNLETIVLASKKKSDRIVVVPHGGPHSAFAAEWNFLYANFALLGYDLGNHRACYLLYIVALVNYTGSVGFGESSINKLKGHIGTVDVEDVQVSSVHCYSRISPRST